MVRKLLMIGGAVALVIGLLIYGILAGLILGSARDAAVQAIRRSVSNILPGSLEVGSVRGLAPQRPGRAGYRHQRCPGTVIGQIDTAQAIL